MRTRTIVLAALLTTAALSGVARHAGAVTKLEGEYNVQLDIRKQDRFFKWDFESNNNDTYSNAQFRLFSQPRSGVEAFLKYEAEWHQSDNGADRPVFQFREGHARYRWELKANRGFDSYLFSRQNRFWVDNYLIQVVQSGPPSDNGNAQGFRLDSWGFLGGVNATAIVSDFSAQYDPTGANKDIDRTDDAYILRFRREFMDKRLRTGFTFNRKNENEPTESGRPYAQTWGVDTRYTLGSTDISLEYAQSEFRGPGPTVRNADALDQKFIGIPISDRGVWVAEIRSLRAGNPKVGYLNVAPTGWLRGPLYDNRLGDSNRDERGFFLNSWYLVPGRAITLTNNFTHYTKKASLRREVNEFYSEAYIEFVNGFAGKTFYRRRRTSDALGGGITREDRNDDLFMELQVESRLAWLRVEGKLKNLDTDFQKELASIETSINLGASTKLYNRLTFGNDPTGLRRVLFSQIQYRPTGNMELFVEYGPGWVGDSNQPVDDGDLEGNAVQKDMIKFWLKGIF